MELIEVAGQGFVGLTTSILLAQRGHNVHGLDINTKKIDDLNSGNRSIVEPDVEYHVAKFRKLGSLHFSTASNATGVDNVLVIAVPCPTNDDGTIDTSNIRDVLERHEPLWRYKLIIIRSTLLPGTTAAIADSHPTGNKQFVYWPEFLNQGRALREISKPDRLVFGTDSTSVREIAHQFFREVYDSTVPVFSTTCNEAEAIKHLSNSLLAVNKAYAADAAEYCATTGLDSSLVLAAVAGDNRLSAELIQPRPGLIDSCLPKDIRSFSTLTSSHPIGELLSSVWSRSQIQKQQAVSLVAKHCKSTGNPYSVLVVGAGFEPNVGDAGESFCRPIVAEIQQYCDVKIWDPAFNVRESNITVSKQSLRELSHWADIVIVLIGYQELLDVDWASWTAERQNADFSIFDLSSSKEITELSRRTSAIHSWTPVEGCAICAA